MTDHAGQQFGNYRLIRLLGQSGLTDVYLGEHMQLEKRVAVKVFSMRLVGSNLDNFLEEAQTIAHLEHPHILRVLDFGIQDAVPYLVTDYMPTGSLRRRHSPGTVLPLRNILSYVKDVASALQYAHDEAMIHRDVKPDNMFVGPANTILLADFRMALTSQRMHYRAAPGDTGAVSYIAPEQIQGDACPASDQYALAAVVCEWLCGEPLFQGSFIEVCDQHLHTPPPLREKIPQLSPLMEEVIQKALAKDADKRFARVQAFADAFVEAAESELPTLPFDVNPLPLFNAQSLPDAATVPMPVLGSSDASFIAQGPVLARPADRAHLSQPQTTAHRHLTRRAVLLGFAGLSLVSGVGVWWATPQKPRLGTRFYTYGGHHAAVTALAWSPDEKRIASGSGDRTVQVWNSATGGNVLTYRGHSDALYAVGWSPDGKRIASGSADQTVQVWGAAESNGATASDGPLLTYKGHASTVNAVAWSPGGKEIASASADDTVQVWSTINGKTMLTYRGHSDVVWAIAWSSDGKRIASASFDRTVQVWNAAGGNPLLTYRGHDAEVRTVAWSPDGRHIASAGTDQTVQVWDAATGARAFTYLGHANEVYCVAWSPDGKFIASASADNTVQVWDATTGAPVLTYRGHIGYVFAAGWSGDSQRIASGGADMTVQIWQAL